MATTDMWLTDDLAGILRGLVLSADAIPAGEYRAGWLAALRTVAVSVGVAWDQSPVVVVVDASATFADGYRQLGPGNLGAFQ